MRASKLLLSAVISTLSLAGIAHAQATNPILSHADPFITFEPVARDAQYILTATGGAAGPGVTLWSGPTPATASATPHVVFTAPEGMTQIWSPTLWKIDGHWWIYFTAQRTNERHKIFVLQSDTDDPLGSYTFKGPFETGRQSIDPSLLVLGQSRYLMYVTVDSGANEIWMRKLKTPMEFEGDAALIAEPGMGWEKGEGSTKNYPVDEGPTALYHNGKTFIVFSASDTASPRYCLGLMTLAGRDPMVKSNWDKTLHPVFEWAPQNSIYGPGRGTFAKGKDGSMWLLYTAKSTDAPNSAHREVRAQRFTWNADGSPNFGAPLKDGQIQP